MPKTQVWKHPKLKGTFDADYVWKGGKRFMRLEGGVSNRRYKFQSHEKAKEAGWKCRERR